jgi:hypothetical protein
MKTFILLVLTLSPLCSVAGDAARWSESIQVFMTIESSSNAEIIVEADSALAPVGFKRDSTGDTYPGGLVKGIFASYSSGNLARAMIVEGSREGCIVFAATNYDRSKEGLVVTSSHAIKKKLVSSFGTRVRFFSEASCEHAL